MKPRKRHAVSAIEPFRRQSKRDYCFMNKIHIARSRRQLERWNHWNE